MRKSSLSWGKKKLAMALSSPLGKLPTDGKQMGLDRGTICFSVVINIGSRGGLDFTIALAVPLDHWGILNHVFVGMWNLGWVSLGGQQLLWDRRRKGSQAVHQIISVCLFPIWSGHHRCSQRGRSLLIFSCDSMIPFQFSWSHFSNKLIEIIMTSGNNNIIQHLLNACNIPAMMLRILHELSSFKTTVWDRYHYFSPLYKQGKLKS